VYQKFSPFFDYVHINILVTAADVVQQRAGAWLRLLPKVGNIVFRVVSSEYYARVIAQKYTMSDILAVYQTGRTEFDYAANRPLEEGVRLEDIDPGQPVEWGVPLAIQECPLAFDEFIACYVSGGTKDLGAIKKGCWNQIQWIDFLLRLYRKYKYQVPLILIGASYDHKVIEGISRSLKAHRVDNHVYVDSYPANVLYILKKAKLFIGYQSGLNILADNLGTRQLMMYFPELAPMQYAWCRPEHARTVFQADLFSSPPIKVVGGHDLSIT
jgi:hypothetical protein